MYTDRNFKSKKELKEAVAARVAYLAARKEGNTTLCREPAPITVFQPNDMFGNPAAKPDYSGQACVEGPHYPEPHRWYATVTIENGEVIKVK